MGKIIDIPAGSRFGSWVVLGVVPRSEWKSEQCEFVCRCDCGTVANRKSNELRLGRTKGCRKCVSVRRRHEGTGFGGHNRLPDGHSAINVIYKRYLYSARKRGIEFSLSRDQFVELTSGNCSYCGVEPSQVAKTVQSHNTGIYKYNGIDRIDNSIGYTIENCATCCKVCNRAKDTMSKSEFLGFIERVYKYTVKGGHE